MKCPFCKLNKRGNHIYLCKSKPELKKEELRKEYILYNYPDISNYEDLHENYINLKLSLPDINNKFGIDFNSIRFLLKLYNIEIRNSRDSFFISNKKREETNIKRYGAKNVLSKGTIKYNKKNKTVSEKYGVDNVFQVKEIIEKINNDQHYIEKYGMTKSELCSMNSKLMWTSLSEEDRKLFIEKSNYYRNKTWLNKYGGHPLNNQTVKEKLKETNNSKYGCDYYFQSSDFLENDEIKSKIRKKRIENGYEVHDDMLKPYELYKKKCRYLTNKIRKKLFENWDGYDYYDGEYIKDFTSLNNTDRRYPTIDHKISIFYGFINDIPVEEICDLENLCITKRTINSSKRQKINYETISKNTIL